MDFVEWVVTAMLLGAAQEYVNFRALHRRDETFLAAWRVWMLERGLANGSG